MPKYFNKPITFDAGYVPVQPFDGRMQNSILAGLNVIVKKSGDQLYCETWGGMEDSNETVGFTTMTGTWSITSGDATVTGAGTTATTELIFGQWLVLNGELLQVRRIDSDTSIVVSPTPASTTSGLTGITPHALQDLDFYRASFARGSAIRLPNGHLFSAGQGAFRLDGDLLSAPLTLTNHVQFSKYNSVTGTYTNYTLGMSPTGSTTCAAVAGGTKNMAAGDYSVRLCPARTATNGYNNPMAKATVTLTANQRVEITLPTADTTNGQDAWKVFGSLYNASVQASVQGPWYLVSRGNPLSDILRINPRGTLAITNGSAAVVGTDTFFLTDLVAGDVLTIDGNSYTVSAITTDTAMTLTGNASTTASGVTGTITKAVYEWLNAEIQRGTILDFDNDTPPRASFVASLGGVPVLVSCRGAAPIGLSGDYNPGPTLQPSKPLNIEAFPTSARVSISPPETILGVVDAQARIFLTTENRLHFASFVSNDAKSPIVTRPFWRSGFRNPYCLVFINGYLYGFTNRGPTRSIADGDEGSEEFTFADRVSTVFSPWIPERVLVAYDAKNEAICFIHNNDHKNANDKWTVNVLCFNLRSQVWSPIIVIESSASDIIVSGAATVSGNLYLNLLYRTAGVYTCKTFKWDAGVNNIGWSLVTEFMSDGDYPSDMCITGVRVTAHTNGGNAGVYGVRSGEQNFESINLGSSASVSGTLTLPISTYVKISEWYKLNCKALQQAAFGVAGNYDGTGIRHRVDLIEVQGFITEGGY